MRWTHDELPVLVEFDFVRKISQRLVPTNLIPLVFTIGHYLKWHGIASFVPRHCSRISREGLLEETKAE